MKAVQGERVFFVRGLPEGRDFHAGRAPGGELREREGKPKEVRIVLHQRHGKGNGGSGRPLPGQAGKLLIKEGT